MVPFTGDPWRENLVDAFKCKEHAYACNKPEF